MRWAYPEGREPARHVAQPHLAVVSECYHGHQPGNAAPLCRGPNPEPNPHLRVDDGVVEEVQVEQLLCRSKGTAPVLGLGRGQGQG